MGLPQTDCILNLYPSSGRLHLQLDSLILDESHNQKRLLLKAKMEELYADALLMERVYEAYYWWLLSGTGFTALYLNLYEEKFPEGVTISPGSISMSAYLSGDAQENPSDYLEQTGDALRAYLIERDGERPDLTGHTKDSDRARLEAELDTLDMIVARLSPFVECYKEIEAKVAYLDSCQETPDENREEE